MNNFEWKADNAEETIGFAERIASLLEAGDVITLEGDLGAGKTTFTKGIARGLGITKTVNSPTFTIIKEYQGKMPLYHMDVYRLKDSDEDLGFDEYFEGDGVTVVEWAHLIEDQLPLEYLQIQLFYDNTSGRKIVLSPKGSRYMQLCKELF
ncbi:MULTISPECIES: tRNA (adenosine(37)-N6)-threonylcarbamoyltransferase complex ATPase subunit type 1 TsaE [Niallia]|uniref:tRNA (adenosine(37)-N6)-threonylcarbamoyltransferase complex ATPase subunit type 1 TsaE n=1 Tax=Niallia TaxID=2837506 RepID=UPI0020C191F4|nr:MULTISPECIES: tRNA (adenosine(37)-N6)-threonylcarbamoyltransferase complex ATPase subunit type 1 TsaE [Niallia]MED3794241.1 tRNA (adenosine(37)-N6)-threonylcarbamoyltransferase complex ATPase subunit type 1 TsaE [Niallia alba]UTI43719.1 tRNA (adenosine(37)-N6)-threonylcarbamoyltransferase complex ATPase subunit type 1 TsaE [Niallia sp. RD1]